MPCYSPLKAFRNPESGEVLFVDRGSGNELYLPCGRCIGCRLERSRQWATRIMFEAQMHGDKNAFITLTYREDTCPYPPSLDHSEFQRFMKRLRKRVKNVRFFVAGEYGDQNRRPHFHACIFGYDFPDKQIFRVTSRGDYLYRSSLLEELWPLGFSSVAELNFKTAAYVARYNLKKVTGDLAEDHYRFVTEDGEVTSLTPEYCRMSLKPGIGATWFEKYKDDVMNFDHVIINGVPTKPPRYFDKLMARVDPHEFELIKSDRTCNPPSVHQSDERLAVRKQVKEAQLSFFHPRGDFQE